MEIKESGESRSKEDWLTWKVVAKWLKKQCSIKRGAGKRRGWRWLCLQAQYNFHSFMVRVQELCERWEGLPGFPSLSVLRVSVDVKQHWTECKESPGAVWKSRWPSRLPVPNSPYGLCGHKAFNLFSVRAQELCESLSGRPGLPILNSPHGPCGHKATLNSFRV